ncbi:MAG: relaxase/mobilization nuclease domain-containing protein, partial [Clostridium sp.]|nr:relaxase/mobilization nuclease domain-containing protein [Clostridium sp.]
MAATRLIALHATKGHTVAQSLGARTDYAKNPEKTEKGELVTGYCCDPMTVDEEFMLQKRLYYQRTGRARTDDVIAYQIRQSFKPGELTPEEANRLGHELAIRFTKGKFSFIVATHTDRAHIHN